MSYPLFPQHPPSECGIRLITPARQVEAPFLGYVHRQRQAADFWTLHLVWQYLAFSDYQAMVAFLDDIGQALGKFCFSLGFLSPLVSEPERSQIRQSTDSGNQLKVSSIPATQRGALFSFYDTLGLPRLHRLISVTKTNSYHTIRFVPYLRAAVRFGTVINWHEPRGLFFLSSQPTEVLSAGLGGHFEIKIQESLR